MTTWYLSENGIARPTMEPELYQLATAGRWDCFACSELTQNQWVPLAHAMQAIAQRPPAPPPPPPVSAPAPSAPRQSAPAPEPAPEPPPAREPPFATYTIMALCAVAFLVEIVADLVSGHGATTMYGFDTETLRTVGADLGIRTAAGQPWRLISAMFLHANLLHIASNMYCFFAAGALAERVFGRGRYVGLYVLAGLGGGVASILWNPFVTSVGASGAIFGIMGALVAFFLLRSADFTPESLKQQRASLLTCIMFNVLSGLTSPVINNAAHMGGLSFGFLAGLALTPSREETDSTRIRAAAATLGVVVLLGGGFALDTWRVSRDPKVATYGRLEQVVPFVERVSADVNALESIFARFYALAQQKPAPEFTELIKPCGAMAKQVDTEAAKLRALEPPDQDCAALRDVALERADHLSRAFGVVAQGKADAETIKTFVAERDAFLAGRSDYLQAVKRLAGQVAPK